MNRPAAGSSVRTPHAVNSRQGDTAHARAMNITTSLPSASALGTSTADPATARDARIARQRQTLAQALNRLGNPPDARQIARQRAADKIGRLQARLMELKMLLRHASPRQARLIAREISGLAGELAQAARAAGMAGSSGTASGAALSPSGSSTNANTAAEAGEAAPDDGAATAGTAGTEPPVTTGAAVPDDDKNASAEDPARANSTAADTPRTSAAARDDSRAAPRTARDAATGSDGSALQRQLEAARCLLREVIALARTRLHEGDDEARRQLADAERALPASGTAPGAEAGATAALYTAAGTTDIGGDAGGGFSRQA
ncbi:hypothetical protein [Derxia gummosa]|uniref:Uncharacterized protein n=1 Tax=Derxia gummosa DSM 723 TaxID=1121388 RepID=A0A8B6XAU1_9BURK|nr:hypothetical protein [Derxia gummosa]